jgi:hypothetical protein
MGFRSPYPVRIKTHRALRDNPHSKGRIVGTYLQCPVPDWQRSDATEGAANVDKPQSIGVYGN